MRILLDNGVPRGVTAAFSDHVVEEARSHGWDALGNGELLDAAERAGFNVILTDRPKHPVSAKSDRAKIGL